MHKFTNTINSLLPHRRWAFPLVGLALILGVVVPRSKPVFSNQMDNDPSSYRVVLPDSGAYLEPWREQEPSATVPQTEGMATIPSAKALAPDNFEQQPIITALLPEGQRPTTKQEVAKGNQFPQQDGVYLYGQSPKSGQLGQGYVVFEKREGRVIGALYMPDSEFSCFNGTVDKSGELAMTVDGYPGEENQTRVATTGDVPKINDEQPTSYAYSLALRDFYRLNIVSDVDHQILKMCQQGGNRPE